MFNMFSSFCFGFFCTLTAAFHIRSKQSELKILLPTIKSDLDELLKDPTTPDTVNFEFTDGRFISISLKPKPDHTGRYVAFEGDVHIQHGENGNKVMYSQLKYTDGIFSPIAEEHPNWYILLTPNPEQKIKPAGKTIRYTPIVQLTKDLHRITKDLKQQNAQRGRFIESKKKVLGATMEITYDNVDEFLRLNKPLKCISLFGERDRDIFFDVWYRPKSERYRYGSSSGSLDVYDAVRVYHEWSLPPNEKVRSDKSSSTTLLDIEHTAQSLKNQVIDLTMARAYRCLFGAQFETYQYKNAIVSFENKIVVNLAKKRDPSNRNIIMGRGTTTADLLGRGGSNVKIFYDGKNLVYKDRNLAEGEFVPVDNGDRTLKWVYYDWRTVDRHLRAIWRAMQGGCRPDKQRYAFNIPYADSITVEYFCSNKVLSMITVVDMVADIKERNRERNTRKLGPCNNIRCLEDVRVACISRDDRAIAIRLSPEYLRQKKSEPDTISLHVIGNEMKTLKEAMVKASKTWKNSITHGTILMDENMLFLMTLPEGNKHPDFVEFRADFKRRVGLNNDGSPDPQGMHQFYGEAIEKDGKSYRPGDLAVPPKYAAFKAEFEADYLIESKYVTVKQLKIYLQKASKRALNRCADRETKSYYSTIVFNNQFSLNGYYDCIARVFLFEGTFKALHYDLATGSEIKSHRPVSDIIYIEEEQFFISEGAPFTDVYALQIPKETNLVETLQNYGSPIKLNEQTFVLLKSRN